jgi:hypothetical protein
MPVESGKTPSQIFSDAVFATIADAPSAVKCAIVDLIVAINGGLDNVKNITSPSLGELPIFEWESLLTGLTEARLRILQDTSMDIAQSIRTAEAYNSLRQRFEKLKQAYENSTLMFQAVYELVEAGQDFQTPEEVMEQSAEILIEEFDADLYVCRMHDEISNWVNIATDAKDVNSIPMFAHTMEESLPGHPVMRAVAESKWSYVLSDNLHGSEQGGDSYDCVAFQEGYRSRLTFILRGPDEKPFGLIQLYSRTQGFFEHYCHEFLSDCSRIVSMTVGSRLALSRDALAKAAGGMAHVGNNALSGINMDLELAKEEIELVKDFGLPAFPSGQDAAALVEYAGTLRNYILSLDLQRKIDLIRSALGGTNRLKEAIINLLEAVEKPRLMHYVRGEEVLDLDTKK